MKEGSAETVEARNDRRAWPVRIYRLGEQPGPDQSALNTPEERLAMMWDLAVEAWSLSGRPMPVYARHEAPVARRPLQVSRPR